jgi:pseudouridine-5'-phosphate glycosidase
MPTHQEFENMQRSFNFFQSIEVGQARTLNLPVVALESTVITHGLPYPENFNLALEMEREVRDARAIPATIAVLDGRIRVGMTRSDLERLATEANPRKVSARDLGVAVNSRGAGGTTVAGTLQVAKIFEIKVFATGGIGGVHRNAPFDVSADLHELSRSPLIVVCAGAKAILDLPATLEYLETMGVVVLGYQTDEFPAFYSRKSGLRLGSTVNSAVDVARIARDHWEMAGESAILVAQPPPEEDAIPREEIEGVIRQAVDEAESQKIRGQALTPFLLKRVSELTGGASMRTNLSLLRNNARLAGEIAYQMANLPRLRLL